MPGPRRYWRVNPAWQFAGHGAYMAMKYAGLSSSQKDMPSNGRRYPSGRRSRGRSQTIRARTGNSPFTPRRSSRIAARTNPTGRSALSRSSSRPISVHSQRSVRSIASSMRSRRSGSGAGGVSTRVARGKRIFRSSQAEKHRMLRRGVIWTREIGGKVTSDKCRYIGHISMPHRSTMEVMSLALIKYIFMRMNLDVQDLATTNELVAIYRFVAGDILAIGYRQTATAAVTTNTFVVGAADTIDTLLSQWTVLFTDMPEQGYLVSFTYTPAATSTHPFLQFNLMSTFVEVYFKSDLKLQNTSADSPDDDEMTSVERIPLIGKSYTGPGNHCDVLGDKRVGIADPNPFTGDAVYGMINADGTNDFSPNLASTEPVPSYMMLHAKYAGKISLEPGEIKTSTLVSRYRMLLNRFMAHFSSNETIATAQRRKHLGKFRIFAIEKIVEPKSAATNAHISIDYENNTSMTVAINAKRVTFTKPHYTGLGGIDDLD